MYPFWLCCCDGFITLPRDITIQHHYYGNLWTPYSIKMSIYDNDNFKWEFVATYNFSSEQEQLAFDLMGAYASAYSQVPSFIFKQKYPLPNLISHQILSTTYSPYIQVGSYMRFDVAIKYKYILCRCDA